jgi:hypothetical protein
MKVRSALAVSVAAIGTAVLGGTVGSGAQAASSAPSAQYVFCHRLSAFGNSPSLGRLVRLHNAAMRLSYVEGAQSEQYDYLKYESALLHGRPSARLRAQADRDCGW